MMKNCTPITENSIVEVMNNRVIISSRKVAARFNKRHDHVLRDIANLAEGLPEFGEMFFETRLPDCLGRLQPAYFMNKDGFSLLAMGFTGLEAKRWKVSLLKEFNRMTAKLYKLSSEPQPMQLRELELLAENAKALVEQAKKIQELADKQDQQNKKLEDISNVISINNANWRKETNKMITDIAKTYSGSVGENLKEVRNYVYALLNERLGVNLPSRLSRYKKRLANSGATQSEILNANYLDVIGNDKKLIECFVAIIKELSISNIGKAA